MDDSPNPLAELVIQAALEKARGCGAAASARGEGSTQVSAVMHRS